MREIMDIMGEMEHMIAEIDMDNSSSKVGITTITEIRGRVAVVII